GKTLVGRVAISGWSERTNLPVLHLCPAQKIEQCVGGRIKRTDAERTRQRSGVHENARRAVIEPAEKRRDGTARRGRHEAGRERPVKRMTFTESERQNLNRKLGHGFLPVLSVLPVQ